MPKKNLNASIYLLHIALILILVGCGRKNKFIVEGSFTKYDPTDITLYLLSEEKAVPIDSVEVNEDGSFKLTGNASTANIYNVSFFNGQSIYLVIKPGDKINLDIDNSSEYISYYVKGSFDSKLIKELNDKRDRLMKSITQLSQYWEKNKHDSLARAKADSTYASLLKEHREYSKNLIHKHPNSLAGIFILYQNFGKKPQPLFDKYEDFGLYTFVDSNLYKIYPESDPVKVLNKEVVEIKEQLDHKKYMSKMVKEGRPLPQLEARSIKGDTISIKPFSSKRKVIYTWSIWNKYSTDILLTLDSLYKTFPLKDSVQVVTISLDNSEDVLVRFVDSNHIKIPVLCDYGYWESEYVSKFDIRAVPSLIVTNKQGIITENKVPHEKVLERIKQIIK